MEVLFLQRYGGTPFYQQKLVFGTVLYAVGFFLLFLSHPAWGRGSALAKCGTVSLGIYAIHPTHCQRRGGRTSHLHPVAGHRLAVRASARNQEACGLNCGCCSIAAAILQEKNEI
jgi:hypothetical protein